MSQRELELWGTFYQSEARETDELMIANMLSFLNNQTLIKMLDDEELKAVLQTVKNHVVTKAKYAQKIQQQYVNEDINQSISKMFK